MFRFSSYLLLGPSPAVLHPVLLDELCADMTEPQEFLCPKYLHFILYLPIPSCPLKLSPKITSSVGPQDPFLGCYSFSQPCLQAVHVQHSECVYSILFSGVFVWTFIYLFFYLHEIFQSMEGVYLVLRSSMMPGT